MMSPSLRGILPLSSGFTHFTNQAASSNQTLMYSPLQSSLSLVWRMYTWEVLKSGTAKLVQWSETWLWHQDLLPDWYVTHYLLCRAKMLSYSVHRIRHTCCPSRSRCTYSCPSRHCRNKSFRPYCKPGTIKSVQTIQSMNFSQFESTPITTLEFLNYTGIINEGHFYVQPGGSPAPRSWVSMGPQLDLGHLGQVHFTIFIWCWDSYSLINNSDTVYKAIILYTVCFGYLWHLAWCRWSCPHPASVSTGECLTIGRPHFQCCHQRRHRCILPCLRCKLHNSATDSFSKNQATAINKIIFFVVVCYRVSVPVPVLYLPYNPLNGFGHIFGPYGTVYPAK